MALISAWRLRNVSNTFVALLYVAFGLGDLAFSLTAFRLGVPEGNPLLAWACAHGCFVPAKLGLTLVAARIIELLYGMDRARFLCWCAVAAMALVDIYHIVLLTSPLPLG